MNNEKIYNMLGICGDFYKTFKGNKHRRDYLGHAEMDKADYIDIFF